MKLIIPPPAYGLFFLTGMWWLHSLLPQFSFSFIAQKPLATIVIVMGLMIDVIAIISFIK
jgi:hypothetical protein